MVKEKIPHKQWLSKEVQLRLKAKLLLQGGQWETTVVVVGGQAAPSCLCPSGRLALNTKHHRKKHYIGIHDGMNKATQSFNN